MATNKESYKSDELLARAFDWYCDTHNCSSCKHYAVKQRHNSRSHCFLAWQKDEADVILVLEPCRFCGSKARLSYGNAVISCNKCGYELRGTYVHCATASLQSILKGIIDVWNKLQKGEP